MLRVRSYWAIVLCVVGCADTTQVVHDRAGGKGGASGALGEGGAVGEGGALGEGAADAGISAGGHEITGVFDASEPPGVLRFASLQDLPSQIVTDGKNVYWSNLGHRHPNGTKDPPDDTDGQIVTCPVEGCSGAPTVLVSGLSTATGLPIAVAGGNVYWADDSMSGTLIERCVANQCTATRSTLIAARTGAMVADAKDVYWVDYRTVNACSTAGCSTPRIFGDPAANVVLNGGLAIDDDDVYWTQVPYAPFPYTILSCPKSGCTGAPRVLLAQLPYPSEGVGSLVVAGDSLYFATVMVDSGNFDGRLFRCAKTGCDTPTVLAAGLSNPSWLGTDGTTLYFSEHPNLCCTPRDTTCCQQGDVSRISQCAATGCNGMPTVLVPGMSAMSNMAADSHHVFWATLDASGTTGTVHMLVR